MTDRGRIRRRTAPFAAFLLLAFLAAPARGQGQAPHAQYQLHAEAVPPKSRGHALECPVCSPPARISLELPRTSESAAVHVRPEHVRREAHPRGRNGIGRTWRFSRGRTLNADLTPSPDHCAPNIELRF